MAKILRRSSKPSDEKGRDRSKKSRKTPPLFGLWIFLAFLFVALLILSKAFYKIQSLNKIESPLVNNSTVRAESNQYESPQAIQEKENNTYPSDKVSRNYQTEPLPNNKEETKAEEVVSSDNKDGLLKEKNVENHDVTNSETIANGKEEIITPQQKTTSPFLGQLCIIIDDMGHNLEVAKKFLEIPYPIAFAVIPFTPKAKEVARLVTEKGRMLLLHMPMEAYGYPRNNPGKGTLRIGQSEESQRQVFLEALKEVPGAVGVNNHMGSRFTEDRESMRIFLTLVKEQGLFFLDSVTTHKTVACEVARSVGVTCYMRNVFIDHEPNERFIKFQLNHLFNLAAKKKFAIAIGHPHKITFEMLSREIPLIDERKLEMVFLSNHSIR